MFKLSVLLLASLVAQTIGHAAVKKPPFGSVAQKACGAPVYKLLTSDLAGPMEAVELKIDDDYDPEACDLYFCRGANYEDNVDNTREYEAGTVVPFEIDIVAHHTGYAVDLAAKVPIARLFTWPVYANESLGPSKWPKNESSFEVTIPDLGGKCSESGACAIQWYWLAYPAPAYPAGKHQTYMSCVDFTQQ
ncbi:chitin binding [Moniliophthora roreri MCA 2997]|uniref:Chitin binding n=1 Tax=Moniliophthora roreri (strain MCA 2997) TaxID=1381753 RepID=V2XDL4_MONRO|nr:chitin binding [Moniliophthora roreri MCA 2997]